MTQTLSVDKQGIALAADLLRGGSLVAFPTETVYGLGGDARSDDAVARIFAAKGRPSFNPLIVHIADAGLVDDIAEFGPNARLLAAEFWPGPMTLVLPLRLGARISPLVTAGLGTVAVRVPANPVAQQLLAAFAGPIAAPSANRSGRVSPTDAGHVLDGLDGKIDAVLDGGACSVGLESTIIRPDPAPVLLRPGGVPVEAVERLLQARVQTATEAATKTTTGRGRPTAPGQLASHYAPEARVRLGVTLPEDGEVLVGFGSIPGAMSLSERGDLTEAAARLFRVLREADRRAGPTGRIGFAPIPDVGLGRAINDRLRRAAAPRSAG